MWLYVLILAGLSEPEDMAHTVPENIEQGRKKLQQPTKDQEEAAWGMESAAEE